MKHKKVALKRTIKLLSVSKNPKVISSIIANSPDPVIKSICNAALNAAKGSVYLKKKQKKIFGAHRQLIDQLIQKGEPVSKKRKALIQSGGQILGLVIPALLSAVLSSLGTKLFT